MSSSLHISNKGHDMAKGEATVEELVNMIERTEIELP